LLYESISVRAFITRQYRAMFLLKTMFVFLAIFLSLSIHSVAFTPLPNSIAISKRSSVFVTLMNAESPAGSFFNRIPDDKDGDGKDQSDALKSDDPVEESWAKMLESRQTSNASTPSTIGGVPTSEATGFGNQSDAPKIIKTKPNSSGDKSFIGIGKPMNDINNPQFDDQGYTLYANEETGEKTRVFEALVDYPSIFKLKIIGVNESTFALEMVQIVADSCNVAVDDVAHSTRVKGKWLSVTVNAPVENAKMLYSLYENIDKDPRVKFKF
jgi:putative lipoic acid-binding regulatory protein